MWGSSLPRRQATEGLVVTVDVQIRKILVPDAK